MRCGGAGTGPGGEFLRDLVLGREAHFKTKALKENQSPVKHVSLCPSCPSARGGAPATRGSVLAEPVLS